MFYIKVTKLFYISYHLKSHVFYRYQIFEIIPTIKLIKRTSSIILSRNWKPTQYHIKDSIVSNPWNISFEWNETKLYQIFFASSHLPNPTLKWISMSNLLRTFYVWVIFYSLENSLHVLSIIENTFKRKFYPRDRVCIYFLNYRQSRTKFLHREKKTTRKAN